MQLWHCSFLEIRGAVHSQPTLSFLHKHLMQFICKCLWHQFDFGFVSSPQLCPSEPSRVKGLIRNTTITLSKRVCESLSEPYWHLLQWTVSTHSQNVKAARSKIEAYFRVTWPLKIRSLGSLSWHYKQCPTKNGLLMLFACGQCQSHRFTWLEL